MNVTIQDAINAFSLLQEHVNENGFLHECYNLGISALKTIQDGNYQLNIEDINYREQLEKIASYECDCTDCENCKYHSDKTLCISVLADVIVNRESEVKKWIQENY